MNSNNQLKVFLGGTCNGSTWRDELIPLLSIDYFNPVVEEWTDRARFEEIEQRKNCDFCLYVITPEMKGFYSIAEVVDDSNKRPEKVILCILKEANGLEFDDKQYRSLMAVADMVAANGAKVYNDLSTVASILRVWRWADNRHCLHPEFHLQYSSQQQTPTTNNNDNFFRFHHFHH